MFLDKVLFLLLSSSFITLRLGNMACTLSIFKNSLSRSALSNKELCRDGSLSLLYRKGIFPIKVFLLCR